MMRPSNDLDAVWLTRDPVDFRKGINGLSVLVEEQLMRDPFCGQLFVFVNKKSASNGRSIWTVMS